MKHAIEQDWLIAKECYSDMNIDVEQALIALDEVSISINCWQGDDITGFEHASFKSIDGIYAIGNYPGKAVNAEQLRSDLEQAFKCIPGPKRVNIHAMYLESEKPVERNAIEPKHFINWIMWAKEHNLGLDFNPTCFAHPLSAHGFTLSNIDKNINQFWIEHCQASRRIANHFGKELGKTSIMNLWIPDGMKDITVNRLAPRERLLISLDKIFSEKFDVKNHIDAVESKLFGIGLESYTVGSIEFYLSYAISRGIALCLDTGHFHPAESIADKLSSISLFMPHIILHMSRPVHWDSDHVVLLDDETQAIAHEIIRHKFFKRIHIGLDFFDASINRIAAWIISARNIKKALLRALLEPTDILNNLEIHGNYTTRLALLEEYKSLPWQSIWNWYCQKNSVPIGSDWLTKIYEYEQNVLFKRQG